MVDEELYEDPFYFDAPFYRYGMSADEYHRERLYLNENMNDFLCGGYIPLWKQEEALISRKKARRRGLYGEKIQ